MSSVKFSFIKLFILSQTFTLTCFDLLIIDFNSTVFNNFKAKDSFVKVIFHFTALSLKRCLDISSNPKLLILPI